MLAAKAGEYEVRRYEPMVVAEVTGSAASKSDFDSANFRVLAQYIGVFGTPANRRRGESEAAGQKVEMTAPVLSSASHEPIAMTAPVLSTAPGDAGAGKRQFSLSFILPHKFTEHTAPAPLLLPPPGLGRSQRLRPALRPRFLLPASAYRPRRA